jgi:lipopolysaccharide export system protein LptC
MWSNAVRILKIGLPLAALGLVLLIFVAPRDRFSIDLGSLDYSFEDGLRLENPRFSGADAAGRPFALTAEWALPDGPDPETVALGPLNGETRLEDGRVVTLSAGGGEIRPKARALSLSDGVVVETSDGWRVTAPAASADLEAETMAAEGPVEGTGPSGALEAGAMRAARRADGDYIWFEQGVRLRITPAADKEAP